MAQETNEVRDALARLAATAPRFAAVMHAMLRQPRARQLDVRTGLMAHTAAVSLTLDPPDAGALEIMGTYGQLAVIRCEGGPLDSAAAEHVAVELSGLDRAALARLGMCVQDVMNAVHRAGSSPRTYL